MLFLSIEAKAGQLTTPSFTIDITENCEEGVVGCGDVTYQGVNRKTGRSIKLKGAARMVMCADRKTPCHFESYQFKNGDVTYGVYPNGILTITKGNRVALKEAGQWTY